MKVTTQDFISKFHGIKGITIGERRKHLFQLLNSTLGTEHSEVNFSALTPRTHLEAIFKVEVLLYFKKVTELVEVLKCENPILIEKVIKSKSWFWNEAFKNYTGLQFVDDILGRVSFNTKLQLLNKLAIYLNNPVKGNEYYEAVKSKYGLYLAGKLIPCCTKEFILLTIEKDNIKLTDSKLLLVIKKYPDIIEDIFLTLKNIGVAVSVQYDIVFKYIACTNIKLFLKLRAAYKISVRLGGRCTRKFVTANKKQVVDNANDYCRCFNMRQLVRSLTDQLDPFCVKIFPKTVGDFDRHELNSLLKTLKLLRNPDVSIILRNYKILYGRELWDNSDLISLELLEMMPPAERESKMKREYKPNYASDDRWMCYHPTKVSIPYLKERISLSSDINSRAELVGRLVETCQLNKDKASLAHICQFMVNRHRNDNFDVRLTFLRTIQNSFELDELEERHWTPINELIKLFILNDEQFYNGSDFLSAYILFRLKHNLPIEDLLIEYCNLKCHSLNLFKKYPKQEKACLLQFANVIQTVYKDEDLLVRNIKFICAIISYNQRNKHDQISIFAYPKALQCVEKVWHERQLAYDVFPVIAYSARLQDADHAQCITLVNSFLKNCESADLNLLIYLIHKNPALIQKHIEKVIGLILKQFTSTNFINFWKFSKNYEHLEIPQNIIKMCLVRIKEDSGDSGRVYQKKIAIRGLSCLMPTHEYLQIVTLHYPRELKADAGTQAGQKTYELQEYIASSLRDLTPPSEALESILIFCKGDYLKLIQSSLYSVCCNTNEDKLQPFFAELIGRAVSIRKHALHLTFHVLDKAEIFSVLDKFMKNEKNPSIRKFIFKHSFNFFIKNRDDYSWELVKLNIGGVDVNDQEALDILLQHKEVPRHYLDKYLTFTWEFLEKLPDNNDKIEIQKTTLLNSVEANVISLLGKQFCESILQKYLLKFSSADKTNRFHSAIESFACKYVIYAEPTYVSTLFIILKDYINTNWVKRETEATSRLRVQEFIERLCNEFLGNDDAHPHADVLSNFANLWNEFLKPHEAFTEYLHLKLSVLYLQKRPINYNILQLTSLCNDLVNTYGIAVIGQIAGKIDSFVNYFVGSYEQEDVYSFIYNIVENHSSLPCILLALRLIESNKVSNITKEKFESIVQILKSKNEPVIQIFLHAYFTRNTDFY